MKIPANKETISYIHQYGGSCRDCADHDGVCPNSGLPCYWIDRKKAIKHVISALNYGRENGFLPTS